MIHFYPSDIWDIFLKNKDRLRDDMIPVAQNDDFGVEICLTEFNGVGLLSVTVDGDCVQEETIVGRNDAEETASELYDLYITGNVMNTLMEIAYPDEENEADQQDMIDDRELELDDALYDLLSVLDPNFNHMSANADEIYSFLKDLIAESLFKKFGISIYRPMYLEDTDGNSCFEEYPYSEMEFDDD